MAKLVKLVCCGIFVAAIASSVLIYQYGTIDEVTFQVVKTERVTEGQSSTYLVFTPGETFQNADNIMYWKFNSSDLYGQLREGETYRAKVNGFRVPVFSMYRNILQVQRDNP